MHKLQSGGEPIGSPLICGWRLCHLEDGVAALLHEPAGGAGGTTDTDGQQRLTSLGRFVKNKFAVKVNGLEQIFDGLNWGDLYERFHSNAYNHNELSARVAELYADDYVSDHKGIFEFVLGGCKDTRLLNVRLFDKPTT